MMVGFLTISTFDAWFSIFRVVLPFIIFAVVLSAVFVPLLIKYIRHKNFKYYSNQGDTDKLAIQTVEDTLTSTNTYLFYVDDDGFLRFSEQFFNYFCVRPRNLSLESLKRTLIPTDRQKVQDAFDHVDSEGLDLYVQTIQTVHRPTHYFLLTLYRIEHAGKEMICGMFYVIDHIRRQQDELREACRREEDANLKTSFLASMGHEIRNPLNAIVGFSRLLVENRKSLSREEFASIQETINQSNKQLLELLNNVMKYSASSTEKLSLPLTEKNVEVLMNELYTMHTVIVPKQLEFRYQPGDSTDVVMANRSSLFQIVSNLINNAIKFTPEGSITLGWKNDDKYVIIFVEDTGVGIEPENQERIFDKYFKKSSMMAGAGLGLSLCKKLTEAMHGEISVQSELDMGARFEVRLPRCQKG